MVTKSGAPRRGDLIWLDFAPSKGHEQTGRRPALVLTSKKYNQSSGLALVCPITTKQKGYPFEVPLLKKPKSKIKDGVILVDQVRSVSWADRNSQFIEHVSPAAYADVSGKIKTLI